MANHLIVSADDFGLSDQVNEAVERAHREGVLRSASLMVGAPGTADAIRRAAKLPALRVGLHLVLVNGRPLLPPETIPDLVDRDGTFYSDLRRAGVIFFIRPGARRQLEAEIRAQFAAFAASGLALDHVNAQNHMHVHPTVLGIVLRVGRDHGMRAVRIPSEPGQSLALSPWLALMRRRLERAGMVTNDRVLGIRWSGHMNEERVLQLLRRLPSGVTEMYFHPATAAWPGIDPAIATYDFGGELAALTSDRVRAALATSGANLSSYSDIVTASA
jgi:chitin disaccharide deacetylase